MFSQWPDALRLVGKALDMQDPPLRHVTLASGSGQAPRQAIKLFQESETVRVFLLPMRAGAAGLTLNRGTCLALAAPVACVDDIACGHAFCERGVGSLSHSA